MFGIPDTPIVNQMFSKAIICRIPQTGFKKPVVPHFNHQQDENRANWLSPILQNCNSIIG